MIVQGVQHIAEITRVADPVTGRERFHYALLREASSHIIYRGEEPNEPAAIRMAQMYLRILDDSAALLHQSANSRSRCVRFVASTPDGATLHRGE